MRFVMKSLFEVFVLSLQIIVSISCAKNPVGSGPYEASSSEKKRSRKPATIGQRIDQLVNPLELNDAPGASVAVLHN
jgi:hypothetical protein